MKIHVTKEWCEKSAEIEGITEIGAGCPPRSCYRLLDCNDDIRGDDEFLEDDETTWTRIDMQHTWNVGSYWHTALKPMRRIIGDNAEPIHGEKDA